MNMKRAGLIWLWELETAMSSNGKGRVSNGSAFCYPMDFYLSLLILEIPLAEKDNMSGSYPL